MHGEITMASRVRARAEGRYVKLLLMPSCFVKLLLMPSCFAKLLEAIFSSFAKISVTP
jgi:hypothetical protein